jgi:hypothetical protein
MKLEDRLLGAALGAGIALVGGQLGPQVGVPEEIVTVPVLSTFGFIVGASSIEKFFKGFL